MAGARNDGASGCESGNLPGLVEAGTLREKECGDGPRYSREAFLLRGQFSFWLVCFGLCVGASVSCAGGCCGAAGAQARVPAPLVLRILFSVLSFAEAG
jgi:hypothetical protein